MTDLNQRPEVLQRRPSVVPALCYRDPMAAFEWVQKAFGFEPTMLITDAEGNLAHSELSFEGGCIMVGSEWSENHKSPRSLGDKCTQTVHVQVSKDIDGHCERARAAGAEILAEPENQFYGDRSYRARDLEGHIWTFGQTVEDIPTADWEKATGLKTKIWE
jgi:uncharacterized glyoxalase superfamily protein PhnB